MTVKNTTSHHKMFALALVVLALAQFARAAESTALDLIKEGNRYLGEEAKDKVVQIRSEKSVGTLTPTIWYVVYYDPDATFKATEVKFGAGKKLSVKRPARVLEFGSVESKQLDRAKMKVDSNQALKIATAEPLVQNLKVNA